MFDRSQMTRLLTLALATCAVTWMLAASALARPEASTAAPKVHSGIGNRAALPHSPANSSHDVDPLVIVLTLAGVVLALGATTLIATRRPPRPALQV